MKPDHLTTGRFVEFGSFLFQHSTFAAITCDRPVYCKGAGFEALLPYFRGQVGRPEEDRAALARAFIAKAVFDVPTTRGLIERLEVDGRLCIAPSNG